VDPDFYAAFARGASALARPRRHSYDQPERLNAFV
jgi:hypothetical protein